MKMTMKQRKWLQTYIETGNATQAAKAAGYNAKSDHAFWQIGYENLRKLEVSVREIMDKKGITDARLMDDLDKGLNAERTEFAKFKGQITDKENVIDYQTRHKYIETVLKLKGLLRDTIDVTRHEAPPYDGNAENAGEYVRKLTEGFQLDKT